MKDRVPPTGFSLRTKLVLSYLAVALGPILLLSIAVTLLVPRYFASQQQDQLKGNAQTAAQQIGVAYHNNQNNFNIRMSNDYHDYAEYILDKNENAVIRPSGPPSLMALVQLVEPNSNLDLDIMQAGQGHEKMGQLQAPSSPDSSRSLDITSASYVCEPIYDNGNSNGAVIGELVLITSTQNTQGSSSYGFLTSVNNMILITGGITAVIVALFSLLLARSLTNPLKSLTAAAKQMQNGNYAQRVVPPKSQDEIGHLAVAFNAMASTIESDVNELRRQEQLRRDLIINISHDLITPLTAVQGFSEALADEVITDARARQETAYLIGNETQRVRRLVSDMQHMMALESGQVRLDFAPLDMYSLVNETLAVFGSECEQAGITLHNELTPGLPMVLADSGRMTQVLLNLLDNARRHTPRGGTIVMSAKPEERWLTLSVSDTGSGIHPNDLPNIFERFYRADRSRTGATGGSGLGLPIVKAIITAHGGMIRAESQPGRGTHILFTLPLATHHVMR